MNNQFSKCVVALFVFLCPYLCFAASEDVVTAKLCDVASNPEAYNHKLLKLSGNVTRGYKLFTLSGDCKPNLSSIWLSYGGLVSPPSIFNAQQMDAPRSEKLTIDSIPTTLMDDAVFQKFNQLISSMADRPQARVTLIGRYFAGHPEQIADYKLWKGFGPMGCCTLLVIQQVVSVKGNNLK